MEDLPVVFPFFSFFVCAVFDDLLNDEVIVACDQQTRQDALAKEVGSLKQAEVLSGLFIHEGSKLGEKAGVEERNINESRVDEQFHLGRGGVMKRMNLEMAFPGFEDDFDAPTHPVDEAHRLGIPDILGHVGEKDFPSEKGKMGWIGIEPSVSIVEKFSPSFPGDMLRDRNGHYPNGESFLAAGKECIVKGPVSSQTTEEIKAFSGVMEEGYLMRVATQVERFLLTNGSEDTKGRVAQVTNHQIPLLDKMQDGRRGTLVVASVGSKLKGNKCIVEGVVDGLKLN
ncbi:MAG: hypothetical protein QG577_228 [Thermodesulfobacteriota bacterium]|nr:hypothetical protein [Thermodesulfobacteriota bacterium]